MLSVLVFSYVCSALGNECLGNVCADDETASLLQRTKNHNEGADQYDYYDPGAPYFEENVPMDNADDGMDDGPEVWLNTYEKDGDICEFAALCHMTNVAGNKIHPFMNRKQIKNSALLVADCAGENSNYDHITSNWKLANKLQGLDRLKKVAPWVGKTDFSISENCYETAHEYNKWEADCTFYKNKQDANKRCYK